MLSAVVALAFVLILWLGMILMLDRLRQNLSAGEVVGVNFAKGVTMNRTIVAISTGGRPIVKDPWLNGVMAVDRRRVYFPSKTKAADEPIRIGVTNAV